MSGERRTTCTACGRGFAARRDARGRVIPGGEVLCALCDASYRERIAAPALGTRDGIGIPEAPRDVRLDAIVRICRRVISLAIRACHCRGTHFYPTDELDGWQSVALRVLEDGE